MALPFEGSANSFVVPAFAGTTLRWTLIHVASDRSSHCRSWSPSSALALWQFLATVPIFGRLLLPRPFFFSNPMDVGSQIFDWFSSGVIWKHLAITLWEVDPCFRDRFARRRHRRLLVRAPAPASPPCSIPM